MFNFNEITPETAESKIRETRAANEAKREMLNMLTDVMLNSNIPETAKASLRIIRASQDIEALIHNAATEASLHDKNLDLENVKKYLLIITACHNQIKAFLESNPLVANTEENDEGIKKTLE